MSKVKKYKKTDSNPARQHTLGHSFAAEARRDYEEAKENIKKFEHPAFGGLSLWLHNAARYYKMAADRYDHADELLGNTLTEYVEENK